MFSTSFIIFGLSLEKANNPNYKRQDTFSKLVMFLLTILSGFSLSGIFMSFLHHQWLSLCFGCALALTSVLLTSILLRPSIEKKKLISKYRDSEKGLIKP
jgi:hypothetical protein